MADAECLLAMVVKLVGSAQHAADIGADLDVIFACRPGAQHGVITDHIADFQFRQLGLPRQMRHNIIRDRANFILAVKQHGNEE